MTTSTDLDDTLANIRARAEAAWAADRWSRKDHPNDPDNTIFLRRSEHVRVNVYCGAKENADFLFHARTDVPRLLDLLDEQRAVIARVRAIATELRESTASGHPSCAYDEDCAGCVADALDAALDGADTTTTDGSEA